MRDYYIVATPHYLGHPESDGPLTHYSYEAVATRDRWHTASLRDQGTRLYDTYEAAATAARHMEERERRVGA